jgi:hypothetical protein
MEKYNTSLTKLAEEALMPECARRGYFRIDLADNCNIRCIMCQAYNALPVNSIRFIDFDRFVEATRGELSRWEFIQLGNVAEATIHPRFPDFPAVHPIRSARQHDSHRYNGKTLHKFADLINELGNCLVQISMDSIRKETHEYIRAGSNYDRALDNLACWTQRGPESCCRSHSCGPTSRNTLRWCRIAASAGSTCPPSL